MIERVANQLGGCVKSHRLSVEDRAEKHVWMMALHPGGSIGNQSEGRRVRFWKAITPEPLQLLEGPLGEIAVIAVVQHPSDELVLERMDAAGELKCCHGATKL